jgi:hypothetical protein
MSVPNPAPFLRMTEASRLDTESLLRRAASRGDAQQALNVSGSQLQQ